MHKILLYITGVAALLLASGNGVQASQGTATATIGNPVGLSILSDLAFGTIVPGTGGTVIINPDSGARTPAGGVILVNSVYHPALFSVIGNAKSNYHVRSIPNSINITKTGSTETMKVTFSFSSNLDGSQHDKLDNSGNGSFKVGGTLTVAANQAPGLYTGTFPVTIQNN